MFYSPPFAPSRYGDVVGFYLGHRRTVLLSSPELIVESMTMEQLSNRRANKNTIIPNKRKKKEITVIYIYI